MPPSIRFDRQQILETAISLVREEGMEALNARAVAGRLGCSTQPVFRAFDNMEQLRQAVIEEAQRLYDVHMENSKHQEGPPYKAAGMAYVHFAREERELFRLLFMRDRRNEAPPHDMHGPYIEYILDTIVNATGITRSQAYTFHLIMWIYVHGLASMVATHYQDFSDEDIDLLLTQQFQGLKRGLHKS